MLHLKVFSLELAQSGYEGPEFTCPDHDSTSTCTRPGVVVISSCNYL